MKTMPTGGFRAEYPMLGISKSFLDPVIEVVAMLDSAISLVAAVGSMPNRTLRALVSHICSLKRHKPVYTAMRIDF